MSVRSRITYEVLPRSVTRARHWFEGGVHALAAVGLTLGEAFTEGVAVGEAAAAAEADADGEGVVAAIGVEPVHADAISAVTASVGIQLALLMSCSGNRPPRD
jgi:hypothetical protein